MQIYAFFFIVRDFFADYYSFKIFWQVYTINLCHRRYIEKIYKRCYNCNISKIIPKR